MQHETHHTHEENTEKEVAHHGSHAHAAHKKSLANLSTQSAVLIGAVVIALSILAHGYISPSGKQGGGALAYLDTFTGKAPGSDAFIEGKKDSKVYFVEYSDSECPYCTAFHKTVSEVRQKYAGKITFIYRHFPLTSIHPDALPEAIVMNCIGKYAGEKAYYDFMTKLFDYKSEKQVSKLPEEFIQNYAASVKIKTADLAACRQDPSTAADVQASLSDGMEVGVNGTPSSFILIKDGDEFKILKKFDGAAQSSFVIPLIEKALKS